MLEISDIIHYNEFTITGESQIHNHVIAFVPQMRTH